MAFAFEGFWRSGRGWFCGVGCMCGVGWTVSGFFGEVANADRWAAGVLVCWVGGDEIAVLQRPADGEVIPDLVELVAVAAECYRGAVDGT